MTRSLTALAAEPQIMLQAVDPSRNIRRGYRITRTPDLFGWQIVSWGWGRLGCHGRQRVRAFAAEHEAIDFARQLLARRTSAPRRIGVAYRPVDPPTAAPGGNGGGQLDVTGATFALLSSIQTGVVTGQGRAACPDNGA